MQVPRESFAQAHVLVVGDVMLDRYWVGTTSRISPEAPVPIVKVSTSEERPGGAGNVAMNAAGLGARVRLVGILGVDDAATRLESLLSQGGVECRFSAQAEVATITKLRVLSQHQQLIRLDFEAPPEVPLDYGSLVENFRGSLGEADVVVLSDYAKGALEHAGDLIDTARAAGKAVVVDPKGGDFRRYRGATVLTPNVKEFEAVVGTWSDDKEYEAKAARLVRDLGLRHLLVTRGGRGMSLFSPDQDPLHVEAQAREVYDVTGAGDTVCAVLATALAAGEGIRHAVGLANAAAGIVVGKLGAAAVSFAELEAAMRGVRPADRGVMSTEGLIEQVAAARRRGETIVMTNGCFDLLHVGHLRCLEQAKRLGDRLIVAVNDDASVRALKGRGRPLMSVAERMQLLAALKTVDWVVPFADPTPRALIERILPDVLAKGGDYCADQVAGADAVRANGGRVVILEYLEGASSTRLLEGLHSLTGSGAQGG